METVLSLSIKPFLNSSCLTRHSKQNLYCCILGLFGYKLMFCIFLQFHTTIFISKCEKTFTSTSKIANKIWPEKLVWSVQCSSPQLVWDCRAPIDTKVYLLRSVLAPIPRWQLLTLWYISTRLQGKLFIHWPVQYYRLWHNYRCYIVAGWLGMLLV